MDDGTVVADGPVVKVRKPQESLHFLDIGGFWPGREGRHLRLVHLYPILRDDISQESHGRVVKFTLF